MLMKKKERCLEYEPTYENALNMDFKKEKRSATIPVEVEHFTYMYQVLYNKIQSLINFSEMVLSKKRNPDSVVCKHWKLSTFHYKDISAFVNAYYTRIKRYFANKELVRALSKLPLDKYKIMLDLPMKDPETKCLVYHYIFISIYELYLSSEIESVKEYLDAITKIFDYEDESALNFDIKSIKYAMKLSKKSEAEIKKKYLGELQYDERASENVMKNLKLGKWGIGLQKSMFEYDKDTYLTDKTAADEVIALMGDTELDRNPEIEVDSSQQDDDEYRAFMPEDDEYSEGFDGDELY